MRKNKREETWICREKNNGTGLRSTQILLNIYLPFFGQFWKSARIFVETEKKIYITETMLCAISLSDFEFKKITIGLNFYNR